jgi:hypothetical protein
MKYIKALVSSLEEAKLKWNRERLDREVRERQEKAAKLGITGMLLEIYEKGYGYQPWITNYQSDSPKTTVSFSIRDNSYGLKWHKYNNYSDDGGSAVTVSLHGNGRELFRDSFKEDINEYGRSYKINEYGFSIQAYVPGEWVMDLKNALDGVAKQKQENEYKARHSQSVMEDIKNRFGL